MHVDGGAMRKRRMATHAAVLTLAAAGLVGVNSAPAQAFPEVCDSGGNGTSWGWVTCWGGTGQWRAKVTCKPGWPLPNYTRYGPWRSTLGQESGARCDKWGAWVTSVEMQLLGPI
jgi:hypothetical protein